MKSQSCEDAIARAKKRRRDYLSPACDKNGNPLTPAQRVRLGVWFPDLYKAALERGRAHLAVTR